MHLDTISYLHTTSTVDRRPSASQRERLFDTKNQTISGNIIESSYFPRQQTMERTNQLGYDASVHRHNGDNPGDFHPIIR